MNVRASLGWLLASGLFVVACGGQASTTEPETTIPPTTATAAPATTTPTTLAATTTTTIAPPAVISTQGLIYATGSARDPSVEWKADFHRPSEPGNWPALVFLPGQAQGTNSIYNMAEEVATHGVAVLVIDYADRSPTAMPNDDALGYREVAAVLGCAIRFVTYNVEGAGSRLEMLAVGGMSVGGGPSAHAALAGESLDQLWAEFSASRGLPRVVECVVEDGSTQVDAFVGVAGAYDSFVGYEGLYGLEYLQERDMQVWELLHGAIELNPELQVRLLHGRADTLIPLDKSEEFLAVLTAAGVDAELAEFDGGHELPHDESVAAVLDVLGVADPADG